MESQMFDNVKFEKEKAIARFNRFRRVVKLWQIFEVSVVFGLISWCSARAPAVLKVTGGYFVEFASGCLFNHHVVFLIGNAIIILLLMLCRENDVTLAGGRDYYDDYVKYSEAAAAAAANQRERTQSPQAVIEDAQEPESGSGDYEKQVVVRAEETKKPISQCDDVAAAIEKATRQIKKFQRMQSETLKRDIAVRPRPDLRRSETENFRKTVTFDAADIESLSSEEFRRRVDAFIDKHWSKTTTKRNQLEEHENYQLQLRKIT